MRAALGYVRVSIEEQAEQGLLGTCSSVTLFRVRAKMQVILVNN
jgi:hypothetical protein